MIDPDTAIALRREHAFPPARVSAFEDPADEKSSHRSQRYSSLISFYRGREPSWYDSVTEEFAGLDRVLDLGCGPGLSLDALAGHGVREPIGVDRWQGFLDDAKAAGRRVVLHDLTLPMPFFRSGSFEGLFSHFALDYMSPIGVQQVLLEARRLLAPGGLMVLYMAGVGLALGDPARTSPYDEIAITRLVSAAGFDDFEVEHPGAGRNTVVRARGPGPQRDSGFSSGNPTVLEFEAGGEIQVAAGIRLMRSAATVGIEVSDGERSIGYRPRLPPGAADGGGVIAAMAVCARLIPVGAGEVELHGWTWRGSQALAVDTLRVQMNPELIRLRFEPDEAGLDHQTVWRPQPPKIEIPGDAYTGVENASPNHQPDEEWRPRGRQVIVERGGDDPELLRKAAESKDHFLVRRPNPEASQDVAALERDWKTGRLHGIVLELDAALHPESLPLLLWAGFRGALIYLEPDSWAAVQAGAPELPSSPGSPLLVVDPALSGRGESDADGPREAPIASTLDAVPGLHLVLASSTAEAALSLFERYPARVLIGQTHESGEGPGDGRLLLEATETLRYLTERTTLTLLRSTSGKSGAQLGRSTRLAAV